MSGDRQTVAGAYQKIESHEDLCAQRYANIDRALDALKGSARQHERAAWGIVLALLAWTAAQLYSEHRPAASPPQAVVVAPTAGSATR